jgi:hypothetical protein
MFIAEDIYLYMSRLMTTGVTTGLATSLLHVTTGLATSLLHVTTGMTTGLTATNKTSLTTKHLDYN